LEIYGKFSIFNQYFKQSNSFYFIPNTAMRLLLTIFLFHFLSNTVFSQWKLLNSNLDTLGISAIYTNDSIWLAGEYLGDALWYSTDKGKSWKTDVKGEPKFYGFSVITYKNGTVVAGGNDQDSGFQTTYRNQGKKFINKNYSFDVRQIIAYPNGEWLRIEYSDIVRSLDNAKTWKSERIVGKIPFYYIAIEKDEILYVGLLNNSVVSTDRGKTFQPYPAPIPDVSLINLAICQDKIIGVFGNALGFSVYSSPLGTKPIWTYQGDTKIIGDIIRRLYGFGNHLFATTLYLSNDIFYSKNLGKTFDRVTRDLKSESHPLCVQVVGDTVLLGTSKGIYWTKLSEIDKAIVLSTENNIDKELLIYPNPTENYLIMEHSTPIVKAKVFDLNGNLLKSDFQKISSIKYQVNIENLPTGMYLIQASTNNENLTKRFFKK
jgi:hypothetical protein